MRKGILFVVIASVLMVLCTTAGCTGKNNSGADTAGIDSTDTTAADTLEQLITEQPMPKAADELFDDFIFNFAANRKLQFKRIKFPLRVVNGKSEKMVEKSQWKMEHFFMSQGYYTLIFDNRRQMKIVKDTSINHVVVEKIYLKRKKVKQYIFNRINGEWNLVEVNTGAMYQNNNASFLDFYQKFATDSAFQSRHLDSPIHFSGPDPDDDFSTMTGDIEPETWPAFAPELPANFIYNIIYGQQYTQSNKKILVMRGIANGMEMELTFVRKGKAWKLTRLSE
ncbi:DUF4348 domain-containing protein [uncultured Prevotella sp.]|uniref:DUF4348 domain-containing protein n=1 Tax=uncultured Prevotella sp. TaxID=159272 RepID=UPI0026386714|nr:DUF4348 domain-containing protein [uncultured Prevotella sp.]